MIIKVMPKVLVVGCGLTGGGVFHYLKNLIPNQFFTFYEKANSVAGRMARVSYKDAQCDVGAQYITKSSTEFDDIYQNLINNNVLTELTFIVDGMKDEHKLKKHYMSIQGLASITESFLEPVNHLIKYNTLLEELNILSTGEIQAISSRSTSNNRDLVIITEIYDIVILTLPTTKITELKGNFRDYMSTSNNDKPSFIDTIQAVKYSSRYALALFYEPHTNTLLQDIRWGAKYVFDDDIIRYISIENRKSGGHNSDLSPLSILIHTSIPYGIQNENTDNNIIKQQILAHLYAILPPLSNDTPVYTELVYWKESQVSKPFNWFDLDLPKHSAIFPTTSSSSSSAAAAAAAISPISGDITADTIEVVTEEDKMGKGEGGGMLVFCGDYFTESNFEGCMRSAQSAAEDIRARLA